MDLVIFFLILLICLFLMFYLYGFIKVFRGKFRKMSEYKILINHFKVPEDVYKDKTLLPIIAFANSFIITNAGMFLILFGQGGSLNFIILIVILIILIFSIYGIIAKILKKKS